MAIVVPYLVAAAGASTAVSIAVGVAFAVTGINDKINQAAASVFGEDLVKVANLAGAAYGAFNGGFDLSSAASGVDSADAALSAFDASQAGVDVADNALAAFDASQVDATAGMGGNVVSNLTDPSSALGPQYSIETNLDGALQPSATQTALQPLADTAPQTLDLAKSAGSTGFNAAADVAPSYQISNDALTTALKTNASDSGSNFFDTLKKMVTNKDGTISNGALQAGGSVLQGAFGGYSAAKAREQAQANYEQQYARQARLANLGTAGWRQTQ